MRDVYQLLREKEAEMTRVRQEIEALRSSIPLLVDDEEADPEQFADYVPLLAVNRE